MNCVVLHCTIVVIMAANNFSRKMCQPELDTPPQQSSMPKLSSTNLIRKDVTEETAKVRKRLYSLCVCVYVLVCVFYKNILLPLLVYVCK